MKKLLWLILLLCASPALAACPGGSTCESYTGQYNYTINGGTTARMDYNRWQDNGKTFPDVGIDCTGLTDSTSALQTAINAMPSNGALVAPIGCVVQLTSTITLTNMVGPQIISEQRIENNVVNAPTFVWNGAGTGPMFSYTSVDHPTVRGFYFKIQAGKTLNGFLNFDGAGGGCCISTLGRVEFNAFDSSNQNNSSFNAIAVSLTSGSNNENWIVQNNDFQCSGSKATLRATNGVTTSGSPNITASGTFVSGDVGKRIRVSYATGILDTTITTVTDSTHLVLAANATSSQTGASVHVGESYGVGFHNGPSANAKHQKLYHNRIANCAKAVWFEQGSFDINYLEGGANDVSLYVTIIVDASRIDNYVSEADIRFIDTANGSAPITISSARYDMTSTLANGFVFVRSNATLLIQGSVAESSVPTNGVFFGVSSPNTVILTSISNGLDNLTETQANLGAATYLTSINDAMAGVTPGTSRFIGLPTSCTSLTTGTLRSNSGVLTLCP